MTESSTDDQTDAWGRQNRDGVSKTYLNLYYAVASAGAIYSIVFAAVFASAGGWGMAFVMTVGFAFCVYSILHEYYGWE